MRLMKYYLNPRQLSYGRQLELHLSFSDNEQILFSSIKIMSFLMRLRNSFSARVSDVAAFPRSLGISLDIYFEQCAELHVV